jgi:hypothetical protein
MPNCCKAPQAMVGFRSHWHLVSICFVQIAKPAIAAANVLLVRKYSSSSTPTFILYIQLCKALAKLPISF